MTFSYWEISYSWYCDITDTYHTPENIFVFVQIFPMLARWGEASGTGEGKSREACREGEERGDGEREKTFSNYWTCSKNFLNPMIDANKENEKEKRA